MNNYRTFYQLLDLFSDNQNPNLSLLLASLLNQTNQLNTLPSQGTLDPKLPTEIDLFKKNSSIERPSPELFPQSPEAEPSLLNLIKDLIEYRKTLKQDLGPQLEIHLDGPPSFSGGFADVYVCNYQDRKVAVKLPKLSRIENGQKLASRELKRCRQLKYPFIAEYLGFTQITSAETSQARLGIVTKYYAAGSLSDLIKQGALSCVQKLSICINLSKAIEFIHIHRLCHFDVKPGNVLIDDQYNPRLSDLGTCQKAKTSYNGSLAFTLGYAPPEQMRGKAVKESDVWNFGMTVYAVFAGRSPFRELKENKEKFCKQNLIQMLEASELPDLSVLNEDVASVVRMCCRVDPADRARLKDVRFRLNEILANWSTCNGNNEMVPECQHLERLGDKC